MFGKTEMKGNRPRDGRHCDLCGCSCPAVRCDKCGSQIFCLSCDDMYHRHPKRKFHLRKAVDPTPNQQARPVLPIKVSSLSTVPGDPSKMPLPPPRKKKPGKSIFDSFRRASPASPDPSNPYTTKKEHSWSDRLGNITKFMSNRPLPPVPDTDEKNQPAPSSPSDHDLSFIHKRVDEKPPALPQRQPRNQQLAEQLNGESSNLNADTNVLNGNELNDDDANIPRTQTNQNWAENLGFGTIRRPSQPQERRRYSPNSSGMVQSSSASDLTALPDMSTVPHMQQYPQHFAYNPNLPPPYPYPMYPPYPQYFGNSWANLATSPQATDADFSDQSEAPHRRFNRGKQKGQMDKKAKRSQSVLVDRMGYPGPFYPFGPYPAGYPGPWMTGHPLETPGSPSISMRSLSRLSQSHRRKVADDEDDYSSSPISRPKSSSSEVSKNRRRVTKTTSCPSSSSSEHQQSDKNTKSKVSPSVERRYMKQNLRRRTSNQRRPSLTNETKVSNKESEEINEKSPDKVQTELVGKVDIQPVKYSTVKIQNKSDPSVKATQDVKINGDTNTTWQCKHCTYINPVSERICQVCCKTAIESESPINSVLKMSELIFPDKTSETAQLRQEAGSNNSDRDRQDIANLSTALDEAEKQINRSLEELLREKGESITVEPNTSPELGANQSDRFLITTPPNVNSESVNMSEPFGPLKARTFPPDKPAFHNVASSTTQTFTDVGNENPVQCSKPIKVGHSPEVSSEICKDFYSQTYQDVLPEFFQHQGKAHTKKMPFQGARGGQRLYERSEVVSPTMPYNSYRGVQKERPFNGIHRGHSMASLFANSTHDTANSEYGGINLGVGPSSMVRSLSRASLLGENEGWAEYPIRLKPDYYLSMEELVERRRQESMRAQGLELVRMIREAEQQGFTADDIQVALNNCGKQNPVNWLQANWKDVIRTVVTLATNYGKDKRENDVGGLSDNEARNALRLHKGNIWAAVTECVEGRQRKFLELSARGNFTFKEIVDALTISEGNVETAYAKLTNTTLQPFMMRIYGSGEGVPNLEGASPNVFPPIQDEYLQFYKNNEEMVSRKGSDNDLWDNESYENDDDWENEELDEGNNDCELFVERSGSELGDDPERSENFHTVAQDNTMLSLGSDKSDYCDAFGIGNGEHYLSSNSIDEIYLIDEEIDDANVKQNLRTNDEVQKKLAPSFLNKLAALRRGGSVSKKTEKEMNSSKKQKEHIQPQNDASSIISDNEDKQSGFKQLNNTLKQTFTTLKETVNGKDSNSDKMSSSIYDKRTIVVNKPEAPIQCATPTEKFPILKDDKTPSKENFLKLFSPSHIISTIFGDKSSEIRERKDLDDEVLPEDELSGSSIKELSGKNSKTLNVNESENLKASQKVSESSIQLDEKLKIGAEVKPHEEIRPSDIYITSASYLAIDTSNQVDTIPLESCSELSHDMKHKFDENSSMSVHQTNNSNFSKQSCESNVSSIISNVTADKVQFPVSEKNNCLDHVKCVEKNNNSKQEQDPSNRECLEKSLKEIEKSNITVTPIAKLDDTVHKNYLIQNDPDTTERLLMSSIVHPIEEHEKMAELSSTASEFLSNNDPQILENFLKIDKIISMEPVQDEVKEQNSTIRYMDTNEIVCDISNGSCQSDKESNSPNIPIEQNRTVESMANEIIDVEKDNVNLRQNRDEEIKEETINSIETLSELINVKNDLQIIDGNLMEIKQDENISEQIENKTIEDKIILDQNKVKNIQTSFLDESNLKTFDEKKNVQVVDHKNNLDSHEYRKRSTDTDDERAPNDDAAAKNLSAPKNIVIETSTNADTAENIIVADIESPNFSKTLSADNIEIVPAPLDNIAEQKEVINYIPNDGLFEEFDAVNNPVFDVMPQNEEKSLATIIKDLVTEKLEETKPQINSVTSSNNASTFNENEMQCTHICETTELGQDNDAVLEHLRTEPKIETIELDGSTDHTIQKTFESKSVEMEETELNIVQNILEASIVSSPDSSTSEGDKADCLSEPKASESFEISFYDKYATNKDDHSVPKSKDIETENPFEGNAVKIKEEQQIENSTSIPLEAENNLETKKLLRKNSISRIIQEKMFQFNKFDTKFVKQSTAPQIHKTFRRKSSDTEAVNSSVENTVDAQKNIPNKTLEISSTQALREFETQESSKTIITESPTVSSNKTDKTDYGHRASNGKLLTENISDVLTDLQGKRISDEPPKQEEKISEVSTISVKLSSSSKNIPESTGQSTELLVEKNENTEGIVVDIRNEPSTSIHSSEDLLVTKESIGNKTEEELREVYLQKGDYAVFVDHKKNSDSEHQTVVSAAMNGMENTLEEQNHPEIFNEKLESVESFSDVYMPSELILTSSTVDHLQDSNDEHVESEKDEDTSDSDEQLDVSFSSASSIRPIGHLRRMSFNTKKEAIFQERHKVSLSPTIEKKTWFHQKTIEPRKPVLPKRSIKQQLEFERKVRLLVSERKCRTYRKAEIVIQLMELKFEEIEAIYAANECGNLDQAVSFLQQECQLCAGKYAIGEMISMVHCSHKACKECLKAYFTIQIRDRTIMELLCPFCNEPDITDEDVAQDYFNHLDIMLKKLMDFEIHELFQRKLRDRVLMKDPNFRWCSQCSSGFITDPYLKRLVCPDCRAVTCASCRRLWEREHEGVTCEVFASWKDEHDPETQTTGLAKLLTEDGIDCPSCHFRYALAKGGCMHFKCTQCQHDFCSGCSKPFKMGKKCGVSEFCAKLGLHAHHPRNCLFYLRDKEPEDLQRLLDMNDIAYNKDRQSTGDGQYVCDVMEQKETSHGMVDDVCGKDVQYGYAGLCRLHYVEYLGQLVNKHKVDPIQIFDNDDLELVLKRASIRLPPKRYRETPEEYRDKLVKLIEEKLSLGEND